MLIPNLTNPKPNFMVLSLKLPIRINKLYNNLPFRPQITAWGAREFSRHVKTKGHTTRNYSTGLPTK